MQFDPHDIDALLAFHRATFGDARMEDPEPGDETPPEGTEDETGGTDPEPFDKARAMAALTKKNSEAAGLRKRLSDQKPLLDELQALKDANKSDADKLTERETKLTAREAQVMRLEVALEKGLTPSQAKRLVGSTQEELEADADELLSELGKKPNDEGGTKPPAGGKPTERLRGGGNPEQEPEETDPAKLAARIPRY